MKATTIETRVSYQNFGEADVTESVFAASDFTVAISNRSPILPGHCLVLPRRTVPKINTMSESELEDFFSFAREVTSFLVDEFLGTGFDWTLQEGVDAGQTIEHIHLHVIPRKKDDLPAPGDWYPLLESQRNAHLIDSEERPPFDREQMSKVSKELRSRFEVWLERLKSSQQDWE